MTDTMSPAAGRTLVSSSAVGPITAAGLLIKVRSPESSTMTATTPESVGRGSGCSIRMPAWPSESRIRSPNGPVPWAPA